MNDVKPNKSISCLGCGYAGAALQVHCGYKWYYFLIALTGVGLLPLAISLVLLGNKTDKTCPGCGSKTGLAPMSGPPSLDAAEIWRRAQAADERRFKRNQSIVAGVLLSLMILAFVLVFLFCKF